MDRTGLPGDFTLAGYAALLDAFRERGYAAVGYAAADPAARQIILRHDLDMSIQAALPIAEIEAERGMPAHYFVLLRTEMYNPWSEAGCRDLQRLAALGHDIGLHFDAAYYPQDDAAIDAAVARECTVLEALLGRAVTTVSFHRPVQRLQGRAGTVGGRRHAYEPRFSSGMGYCSDSRGGWHHGHPLVHKAVAEGRALQLLTHPVWWQGVTPGDPVAVLERFRVERDHLLAESLAAHCEPYRLARGEEVRPPEARVRQPRVQEPAAGQAPGTVPGPSALTGESEP